MPTKIWLHPVDHVGNFNNPTSAVLARIQHAVRNAGFESQKLDLIEHHAARAMPGNLDKCAPEYDISQYAAEVVLTERIRLGFHDRLKEALLEIDIHFGQEIEWCLPFVDFDLYFAQHIPFLQGLQKFPKLHCHVVLADVTNPVLNLISPDLKRRLKLTVLADHTLEFMAPELGLPAHMKIDPPFLDLPDTLEELAEQKQPDELVTTWDEIGEEEPVVPPKPKPKKYRNIDEP